MISEKKMQIVIDNYFKSECNVDTSIRDAFEKGFRIGVQKTALSAEAVQGEWKAHRVSLDFICSNCGEACWSDFDYCPHCGARMKGGDE